MEEKKQKHILVGNAMMKPNPLYVNLKRGWGEPHC